MNVIKKLVATGMAAAVLSLAGGASVSAQKVEQCTRYNTGRTTCTWGDGYYRSTNPRTGYESWGRRGDFNNRSWNNGRTQRSWSSSRCVTIWSC
jgi:hypothetical protein